MELNVEETNIKGVKIIHYDNFVDMRGSIWTTYNEKEFRRLKLSKFCHDKFSTSKKNVIRGIHYDEKTTKLVTAVYGSIDQIVLDMRLDSPTYKNHLRFRINENNRFSILIPPMVGNGFRVISETAVYHYKLSYSGEYIDSNKQYTIKWNDPSLKINWMIEDPILSERDK